MKKILAAVVGLMLFLVAAVLIVPGMIDWNHYKGDIQAQAKTLTGRDLAINGDIKITVLPAPALIANNVSLANVTGASSPHMMRLKLLEVRVALAPLLTGRVEVKRIKLVDPVIEFEVLADGRKNWVFDAGPSNTAAVPPPAGAAPAAAAPAADAGKPADTGAARIAFENFSVENGTLVYRDAKAGVVDRAEQINASFAAASLNGPFESAGSLKARGIPVRYDVNVGDIIQGRTVPFNLKLKVGTGDGNLQMTGTAVGLTDQPRVKGKIKGGGSSLAALIETLVPGASPPPFASQDFSFEGNIAAAAGGAEIKELALRFGSTQATGDITVERGKAIAVATRISANRIDLDAWLAMTAAPAKPAQAGDSAAKATAPVTPAKPAAGAAGPAALAIPTGVTGSLIFSAEAMTYRGGVIRDAVFNAELSNGEITISQLSGQFPGGSDLAVFGFVTVAGGEPRFEGSLESTVNDFHGVLKWLGVDVQDLASERLRKLTLATRVAAGTKEIQFRNLDMQFDSSRLTGGITVALTRRPSFGADLTLDRLNLDAYLKPAPAAKDAKPAPGNGAKAATAKPATAAPAKPAGPFAGLGALTEFDANLKARIATLAFRSSQIKDIVLDGTLYNGRMELRRLGVAKLAGATASVSGVLDKLGGTPTAAGLKFDVAIDDAPRFLRFLGLDPAVPTKNLGDIAVKGRIDGALTAPRLNLNLSGAGVTAHVDGQIEGADLVPVAKKLKFQLSATDASRALKLAGVDAPAVKALGPVKAAGEIDGNLIQPNVTLNLSAAGGTIAVSGPVNVLAAGDMMNLSLAARHPDATQLLKAVGGYRPAGKIGALDVAAKLTGGPSAFNISGLNAKIGDAQVGGDVKVGLAGARPKITAGLTAGPILLDPFLPAQKTASLEDARPGLAGVMPASFGGRAPGNPALHRTAAQPGQWSREPIDLSALAGVDAEIAFKSPLVQYRKYRLEGADVGLKLAAGKLNADRLTGRLFGGQFNATGMVTAGRRPNLETVFSVENMSVKSATEALTGQPIAGGAVSMKGRLRTAGASVADMMSALAGDGSFQMNNVDVSQAGGGTMMSGVFGLVSALNQFTGPLGGGKQGSGLADISGSFQMAGGVARSRDLKLVSGVGNGAAQGAVDLGRWQIDVAGQMQLAPNVLTALLSKKTGGAATQAVPFYVKGRLDSPNVRIDTSKLPGGVLPVPGVDKLLDKAPKGVGNLIQGILGGRVQPQDSGGDAQPGDPSQAQPQPQQQQPAPAKPKKVLRPEDLLKELFKR